MMMVEPIDFATAVEFVNRKHRHNRAPIGHIFSTACYKNGRLCGVAICGRPIGRKLDNGKTIEIYRCCTDGTRNACSKLYSDAIKRARVRGFDKVITYTLQSEHGSSLKASNFIIDADKAGGLKWNGRTNFEGIKEYKRRWAFIINQTI